MAKTLTLREPWPYTGLNKLIFSVYSQEKKMTIFNLKGFIVLYLTKIIMLAYDFLIFDDYLLLTALLVYK